METTQLNPKFRFRDNVLFINSNEETYTGTILSSKIDKENNMFVYIITYYELIEDDGETNTFSTFHEKVYEDRIFRKI